MLQYAVLYEVPVKPKPTGVFGNLVKPVFFIIQDDTEFVLPLLLSTTPPPKGLDIVLPGHDIQLRGRDAQLLLHLLLGVYDVCFLELP